MTQEYFPVLMQLLVATGFAATSLILSLVLGRSAKRSEMKDTAYECGMLPVGEGSPRFSVKFYLVAMLFVIFDIEVVFLYPWAVTFKQFVIDYPPAFWGATGFVGILAVAYFYALKKGALSWR